MNSGKGVSLLLPVFLLVAPPVFPAEPPSGPVVDIPEKYRKCLMMWGAELIVTKDPPWKIADTAQDKCESHMAGYEAAYVDFMARTVPGSSITTASPRAYDSAQYIRRISREALLQVIIDTRLDSK